MGETKMQLMFSSREELRGFLQRKGDWKKWVEKLYKQGSVLSVMYESPIEKGVVMVATYTKKDVEVLMNGVD